MAKSAHFDLAVVLKQSLPTPTSVSYDLKWIDAFEGEAIGSASTDLTLNDGIKHKRARSQFQSNDDKSAAATMKRIHTIWPTIEKGC